MTAFAEEADEVGPFHDRDLRYIQLLSRLTERFEQTVERLERFEAQSQVQSTSMSQDSRPAFSQFDGTHREPSGCLYPESDRLVRSIRPALPDPRLVRRILRQRQLRERFFDGELFADPAWDMLLDLTAARAEHVRVSVTSLCIASRVPPTTALRWISQMTEMGLVSRIEDDTDRRRTFVRLTDKGANAMARYFEELWRQGGTIS